MRGSWRVLMASMMISNRYRYVLITSHQFFRPLSRYEKCCILLLVLYKPKNTCLLASYYSLITEISKIWEDMQHYRKLRLLVVAWFKICACCLCCGTTCVKLFLKLYLLSFSCIWLSKHMSSACFLRLELHLQKKLKNVLVINRID